jgi:shikimate dehydrogenase
VPLGVCTRMTRVVRADRKAADVADISGTTQLVGLIGWPVAHSLSPRMQNAAFAASGLDWVYVPLPTPPERVDEALRGIVALGFKGANVTTPHKLAAARLSETEDELDSVNTLVVDHGRLLGSSTDPAILSMLPAERPVVVGDGGSARAFRAALPGARSFSRRGDWPPDVAGADLIVHATSVRDEVLFEAISGQTLVDLPYPETATGAAARAAGAHVIGGLDVLVAQGAASFERWTGLAAPVEVMRAAVGLSS